MHVFFDALFQYISIHSLRMEGDEIVDTLNIRGFHFNPLPPCLLYTSDAADD